MTGRHFAPPPAEFVGRELHDVAGTIIFQMTQAEFDRIGFGGNSQLVHGAFDREDIGISTKAAQRRNP
ncbi:hypothetical protein AJ87_47910 [Rhizobium yanglingense]|nr:hypothetical protein AJ87_47910 [Rhizobium yanglingense]